MSHNKMSVLHNTALCTRCRTHGLCERIIVLHIPAPRERFPDAGEEESAEGSRSGYSKETFA
jgi:hypothetical protein